MAHWRDLVAGILQHRPMSYGLAGLIRNPLKQEGNELRQAADDLDGRKSKDAEKVQAQQGETGVPGQRGHQPPRLIGSPRPYAIGREVTARLFKQAARTAP